MTHTTVDINTLQQSSLFSVGDSFLGSWKTEQSTISIYASSLYKIYAVVKNCLEEERCLRSHQIKGVVNLHLTEEPLVDMLRRVSHSKLVMILQSNQGALQLVILVRLEAAGKEEIIQKAKATK